MASVQVNEAQFWQSIAILIKNYHALNKKIFEVLITEVQKQQHEKLCDSNEDELAQQLKLDASKRTCDGFRIRFKLLTKKLKTNILANGIVDFRKQSYQCCFVGDEDIDDFAVNLKESQLDIVIITNGLKVDSKQGTRWAEYVLKPKLYSWSQSKVDGGTAQKSLRLVDLEKYNDLYKMLKEKHAQRLIEYWQTANESTDPLKFIYEDLAIAAYLMTLWSCTNTEPTAFADLGCGNGLLVHVLNAEGYKGYGYDMRKRKLWSLYPDVTKVGLIQKTIEPLTFRLDFPDIDWLIGNHSDQLSPWLPVLAARVKTNYFLLPCCAFELSGAKFQRRNTKISTYQDLMQYAQHLSNECGFETLQDRLKIPSTKRLALIGLKRTLKTKPDLDDFINQELQKYKPSEQDLANLVKLREKSEAVRNCTQVDKSILDALVLKIFRMLLGNIENTNENDTWQSGQKYTIHQIAVGLNKAELTGIKCECGGIKTLIKNKHEIFEFCDNDQIGIRTPKPMSTIAKSSMQLTTKKRPCFFKLHHPQGCPLTESECSFIH